MNMTTNPQVSHFSEAKERDDTKVHDGTDAPRSNEKEYDDRADTKERDNFDDKERDNIRDDTKKLDSHDDKDTKERDDEPNDTTERRDGYDDKARDDTTVARSEAQPSGSFDDKAHDDTVARSEAQPSGSFDDKARDDTVARSEAQPSGSFDDKARDDTVARSEAQPSGSFDDKARDDTVARSDTQPSGSFDDKARDDTVARSDTQPSGSFDDKARDDTVARSDAENSARFYDKAHDERDTRNDTKERHYSFDDEARDEAKVSDDKSDDNSEENEISVGERLRQAREQNKMSVKHVADRLYLDVHVIEALEADDYEGLPPTIFVRGYLRNYAKLLEIPPESIVKSFDENQQQLQPSIPTTPRSKPKKQARSRDLLPTIGTVIVVVTLMALMALWQFYPTGSNEQKPSGGEAISSNESWQTSQPMETEPTQTVSGTGTNNSSEPAKNVSATTEQPTPAATSASENTTPSEEPVRPVDPSHNMRVRFKSRAWIRITDNTGKKLYQGTGNAGEILPLEGTPPFYLQVGNYAGVEVEYNGTLNKVTDYPKKRKGGTSIFTIGGEE
jgi:cytoskeleton protein RodZ